MSEAERRQGEHRTVMSLQWNKEVTRIGLNGQLFNYLYQLRLYLTNFIGRKLLNLTVWFERNIDFHTLKLTLLGKEYALHILYLISLHRRTFFAIHALIAVSTISEPCRY